MVFHPHLHLNLFYLLPSLNPRDHQQIFIFVDKHSKASRGAARGVPEKSRTPKQTLLVMGTRARVDRGLALPLIGRLIT